MSVAIVPAAPSLADLADRIYRTLVEHRVDCAPLYWLTHVVGATAAELHRAASSKPYLGVCGGVEPVVCCSAPQPIQVGFERHYHGGRLQLRLHMFA